MRTIFALATARGKSGVAVIRISGPDAFEIGTRLVGNLPAPGHFALRSVRDRMGAVLDDALILTFQAPRSFSGEDTIELQTHGSVAVVQAVERAISDTGLARLAEPGEFTQRALLNGQLDLSQVEGLGDLLAAETELQRQQAQDLFRGTLRDFAETCRRDLLRAMALIEATIDFADEDVPVDVTPEIVDLISGAATRIEAELDGFAVSERLRHGFEIAIVGAPNVGKSTLLNRIAGRDVAITSDVPGTTRDVLEVRTDLNGIPVTFLDTAGLRDTDDVVERIGVGRAIERAQDADLRIRLETSSDDWMNRDVMTSDLVYRTKADLTGDGISALTGEGIDGLLDDVAGLLEQRLSGRRSASHERHRQALLKSKSFLATADECLRSDADEAEIAALHVRDAVNALDSLIGRIDVEAVLGEIFSEFCIGK